MTAQGQVELKLLPTLDCYNDTYCVDIGIKVSTGNSFDIGTASFLLKYNTDAIAFNNYTPVDFDALAAVRMFGQVNKQILMKMKMKLDLG